MSPVAWRRARAVPAVLLLGCGGDELPERTYDAAIDCRPDTAPVLATREEAIAVLDADGDGALTDADLNPGETAVILALTGTHEATGEVSDPGYTIHTDWAASLFAYPTDDASWGIEVTPNCLPMLKVFVNFGDDTLPPSAITQRDFDGQGLGIDVIDLEMAATDVIADFTLRTTGAEGDRVSGYMIGSVSAALQRRIPEEALTGQRVAVEGFAFREIENEEGD
jgi:hypothetical protein